MSENQKQIMENLEKLIPGMTDIEAAHLMGYGEGLDAREDRGTERDIRAALAGRSDAE